MNKLALNSHVKKMDEWSVKKVLARRVCKIFSEMRAFLVERFTAKSFFVSFFDEKK